MADPIINSAPVAPASTSADQSGNDQQQVSNTAAAPASGGLKNPVAPGDQTRSAAPQPPKPPAQKFKLKVDGRDEELSQDDVLKWAQMGRAAQKRFQEAADMRKQAEEFISLLKTNPRAVLENKALGLDVRKFAEDYLGEQLRAQQLSPEQRQIKELQDKLKAAEEEKQAATKQREQQEYEALTRQYQAEYDKSIPAAIEKAGLPRTPYTVKRMTDYMMTALQNGIDVQPEHVIEMVRQDYMSDLIALTGGLDGEKLLSLFGESTANKIRKADLARLKKANQPPVIQQEDEAAPQQPIESAKAPQQKVNPGKKESLFEFRERMDKLRRS